MGVHIHIFLYINNEEDEYMIIPHPVIKLPTLKINMADFSSVLKNVCSSGSKNGGNEVGEKVELIRFHEFY